MKKRGRPARAGVKASKQIIVRLTDEEYLRVTSRARLNGQKPAEYARDRVISDESDE